MKHPEHLIQTTIKQYCDYNNILCFAIPNGQARNALIGKYLKAEGVLAGASDLIVVLNNKVIFVEVKTPTGRQQPTQRDFESKLKELGQDYYIVRSLDEFIKLIEEYKQREREEQTNKKNSKRILNACGSSRASSFTKELKSKGHIAINEVMGADVHALSNNHKDIYD
jgi:hypothetical protein